MYTRIMLLLLLVPLFFSFFFLSSFQTLKMFVKLFSETVRPRRLKLGTHMDSRQMYRVYWIEAAAACSSLFSSFFFLSHFLTLKFFVSFVSGTVRPRGLKLGIQVDSGQMYCVYWNNATALIHLYFLIFLSLQVSDIKNFRHTFLRNCEA